MGIPTVGFKADFTNPKHLREIPPAGSEEVRILSLLGNTLGDGAEKFLVQLAKLTRPGDFLLVDGELFAGKKTLAGYSHSANRKFALAPLLSLGVSERDGALRFKMERAGRPGVFRLVKSFRFTRPTQISSGGRRISFRKNELVRMSPSFKYGRKGMEALLEKGGAFRVVDFYRSPDRGFGLWLARRT